MNATERARISDAYCSGTTTKREVCDAAALLREENENLRAENAKLREQGARLFDKTLELGTENAKLVDVLHEVETEAIYAYHCLQHDNMTIAGSSEHFFKKWWHAECELDRLKAENTKLREQLKEHGIEVA